MGILPPGVKAAWDDNDLCAQADILCYDEVRQHEDIPPEIK